MDWKIIDANWAIWKTRIQKHWPKLTDEDLHRIGGNRLRLADKISQEYPISEVQAEHDILVWLTAQKQD